MNFLLDVEAQLGLSKISGHEFSHREDKIEARKLDYHQKVNAGYREIARQNPGSFRVIPYIDGEPEKMQMQIQELVDKFIKDNNLDRTLLKISG